LNLTSTTPQKIAEYEAWRNFKMKRIPISSTLANHSSAYNRIIDLAVQQGWVSDRVGIPRLSRKGRKGTPRPGFTKEEVAYLLDYTPKWCQQAERKNHKEMRDLLRDYVEVIADHRHA
jgi:hypothetical protein